VQATASTPRESYAGNEPITVTFTVTNTGQRELRVASDYAGLLYRIRVTTDGRPVPRTRYGQAFLSPTISSAGDFVLPPGGRIVAPIPVNRLFDMTMRGTYRVTVERVLLWNGYTVQTEPVVVHVTDDPIFGEHHIN
jgi:hypothetical protein